jgi:hypothetical protein
VDNQKAEQNICEADLGQEDSAVNFARERYVKTEEESMESRTLVLIPG